MEEKQSKGAALKILSELMGSTLAELDGMRMAREQIDIRYQEISETTRNEDSSILDIAKIQWKLDVLRDRAKMVDNMLMKESLTFQIISTRFRAISSIPDDTLLNREDGSDIFIEIGKHQTIQELEKSNFALQAEIKRLELANSNTNVVVDQNNADLMVSNHLMQQSKKMVEKANKDYNEIEKIIRNPASKEGFNINRYIHNYLEGEAEVPPIWDFIYAIRDQLLQSLDAYTPDEIECSLENYIMPILYNKMINDLQLERRDEYVLAQCKKYSSTTQDQFNINPDFKDNALVPYVKAIAELRSIYFQFSPTQKMSAILRAASAVYEVTGQLQPSITMGGDDFIDIWVYVVLHTQLRNLPSTVQYISEYASDDLMTSEMGYYFTSLEVALNFIEKLNDENLKSSPHAQITSRPFIVSEKERYHVFCNVDKHIDMYKPSVTLSGFRLFAIENWVAKPGRFYCTYLQETKDPNDEVSVSILKSNEHITPSQQSFIYDTFFRDKPEEQLEVRNLMEGTVLASPLPPPESLGPHILLVGGDYDKEIDTVKMIIDLKLLGISNVSSVPPYLDDGTKSNFVQSYQLDPKIPLVECVVSFFKSVQIALKHLNIFPYLCVIDGILSSTLTKSIQIFQKKYNDSTNIRFDGPDVSSRTMHFRGNSIDMPAGLPADGSLTPATWKCIEYRINDLKTALEDIGFDGVDDPLKEHVRFCGIIKRFQETEKMMPDGLLNEKTITALVATWRNTLDLKK